MMIDKIYSSGRYSFGLQIFTGIVDFLALQAELPKEKQILKELLTLELIVQIIEGVFYFWMLKSFKNIENITKYRYYDWAFSTSIMLFTLMIYLSYLQDTNKTLIQIYNEKKLVIHKVVILNLLMLTFGYLGEIGKIDIKTSVFLGFIPFMMYYKLIFDNFVSNSESKYQKEINLLFWYFFIFWSLYGLAALLPYQSKNISYNILDLFSKNFFGLFLSYKVYSQRIK